MTTYAPFTLLDLFDLSAVNLDPLTETYGISFYTRYLTQWPEYFFLARHAGSIMSPTTTSSNYTRTGRSMHPSRSNEVVMAYVMGKAEGDGELYHGHVSAVTVAPPYRNAGLGAQLMAYFEHISNEQHQAYFVDLFVRKSNIIAISMYEYLGYIPYRRVLHYYAGSEGSASEDAIDMRKAMARHAERSVSAVIPLKAPIRAQDLEWM